MNAHVRMILNGLFVVFLFLLLFSYAMFQGGFVSWFLFFGFIPIFCYQIGFLLHPIKNWKVTRKFSRSVVGAGESVSVTITIRRKLAFPLYYCICEEVIPSSLRKLDNKNDKYRYMDNPDKLTISRTLKKVIFPAFRREFSFTYQLEHVPRGEHYLNAVRIRTGDFFGLVKKEHVFQLADELVVYPNARPMVFKEQIISFEQGATTSSALQLNNTNVATGIREYMPGDRFSWIDWKQTARKNTVMTKEFEQEKSTDILLVLDGCSDEHLNDVTFEGMVEVTFSLMEHVKKQSTQIGLLTVGASTVYFPIHHDPLKSDMVRQHLTRMKPGGNQSFSLQMQRERMKIASGSVILIITSHIDNNFNEMTKKVNQRSKRVIVLLIQSPKEMSLNQHYIHQLQFEGIRIHVLSQQQLMKNPIEVKGK
ncbi:DUF58 domain-containing protein [Virgibacillus sp. AGTR]|uniref:DUF58 domain-containing protein n=2 Tax=Virgibacillus TaxID=84406 RepID=UPI0019634359|nr:DUF58 domain-containing protein [Virgibacillus sp. AGTR]MCC2252562.1 DUF58 domain-containing protein [Virgibacillus sp. AGTR]QRZ19789.1 DUF58 domain-containing protein [Virgibacillus sp. AGTR]